MVAKYLPDAMDLVYFLVRVGNDGETPTTQRFLKSPFEEEGVLRRVQQKLLLSSTTRNASQLPSTKRIKAADGATAGAHEDDHAAALAEILLTPS